MHYLKLLSYYLITLLYSILIGVIGWSFLYVVNTVTHFLWVGHSGTGGFMIEHKLLIFPFIWLGSMFLAYTYNRFEVIPRPGVQYAKEFKQNQKVVYSDFTKIYILAMIPLFLGSSVGPEAALIGLFFMLSSYIGDATNRIERKFGVEIIDNPQPKFIENLKTNRRYLVKIAIIYGTVAYTIFSLLNADKYPSFNVELPPIQSISLIGVVEIIPLVIVGYLLAKFYTISEPIIEHTFERFDNQYLKMTITAILLSIFAIFTPLLIMSGEATLHLLVEGGFPRLGIVLVILALLKVIITHVCISGDLRGGHIFPIIFSGFLMGAGLSQIFNLDPTLAIAAVTSAMTMTIFSNTLAIFLLLALFFPLKILSLIFIIILIISERRAASTDRNEI